jgi:hypothetical protein
MVPCLVLNSLEAGKKVLIQLQVTGIIQGSKKKTNENKKEEEAYEDIAYDLWRSP